MKANFENIYEHIGYLFYALASEQRPLSEYDLKKLETEISESWQPLTTVEPMLHYSLVKHMNGAITFCRTEAMPSNNAFELFEDFFYVHHLNFGAPLNEKILIAANEISHEFFSTIKNNKGSAILRELKGLLHPHPTQVVNGQRVFIQ